MTSDLKVCSFHVLDAWLRKFIRDHLALIVERSFNLWLWWIIRGIHNSCIRQPPIDWFDKLDISSVDIIDVSRLLILIFVGIFCDWIQFFLLDTKINIAPFNLSFILFPFLMWSNIWLFLIFWVILLLALEWCPLGTKGNWGLICVRDASLFESYFSQGWFTILVICWPLTVKGCRALRTIVDAHLKMSIFMVMPYVHEFFPVFINILSCYSNLRIIILCVYVMSTKTARWSGISKISFHVFVKWLDRGLLIVIIFLQL